MDKSKVPRFYGPPCTFDTDISIAALLSLYVVCPFLRPSVCYVDVSGLLEK